MTTKLSSRWICGRLHVEGVPRGSWETDIAYYKRVARHYTLLNGAYTRDMNLCHAYKMGAKVDDLAVDYGLSTTGVRSILKKHKVPIRNARKPIDPKRNQEIYKLVVWGYFKEMIAQRYGISPSRVQQIYRQEQSRIKRIIRSGKTYIIPPPFDIVDLAIMSHEWTPETQAAEFEQHRDTDIT
jgi:Mor family transcriptional regulator